MKKMLLLITIFVISQAHNYDFLGMKCEINKHKCSQMTSCKEAYFYLKKCGIKKLDRNKDGVPCEKLCR